MMIVKRIIGGLCEEIQFHLLQICTIFMVNETKNRYGEQ